MVAANDGNMLLRLSDANILCTPTGVSKGVLTLDVVAFVDLENNLVEAASDAVHQPTA